MSAAELPCQQCGAPVQEGSLFCSKCGVDVTGVPSSEAETLEVTTLGERSARIQSTTRQMLRDATLGEYEILAELGRGGMATVFLAHDISLDRKVAIKLMAPHLLEGEGMAERFKLEARTAAQLSHPHIIPIYAVKETESTLFFVMKFVEGKPLDEIIKKTGPLPIPMVKDILTRVGSALGYAHRRGVVHRDVKPANIMIDEEGTPIVTDFGIAKVQEAKGLTMTGTTIGTPTYMSPEQCQAREVTGASDQYSLGVVAWEMLTGSAPFSGDSAVNTMYMHCHEPLPPLEDFRPDVSPEVHETVVRMLAKAPEDRWPSLEAAIRKLGSSTQEELDPIRRELLELARETDARELIAQLSTPRSPVPGLRTAGGTAGGAAAEASQAPETVGEAPTRRSRLALAAAALLVLAATGGTLAVLQPWSSTGGVPAIDGGAPSPGPGAPPVGGASPLPGDPGGAATAGGGSGAPAAAGDGGGGIPPDGGDAVAGGPTTQPGPGASTGSTDAPPAGRGSTAAAPPPVALVRIGGATDGIEPGDRIALSATPLTAQGAPISGAGSPRWSFSNGSIGRVDQQGTFTAVGPGSVTVTAVVGGVSGSQVITVGAAGVASLTVEPGTLTLAPGEEVTLVPLARDRNGGPAQSSSIAWRSDAPGVAAVGVSGEVRAVGPGSATITASAGGVSRTVTVTVTAPAVDTRTAIDDLVAAYARALESGDIEAVRRAYPGMTPQQEQQLRESIQFIERAALSVTALEDGGATATANVEGTYEFLIDGRRSSSPVSFRATFERLGGGWRMTRTQ